jgi:hypothetical protein
MQLPQLQTSEHGEPFPLQFRFAFIAAQHAAFDITIGKNVIGAADASTPELCGIPRWLSIAVEHDKNGRRTPWMIWKSG